MRPHTRPNTLANHRPAPLSPTWQPACAAARPAAGRSGLLLAYQRRRPICVDADSADRPTGPDVPRRVLNQMHAIRVGVVKAKPGPVDGAETRAFEHDIRHGWG